MCLQKQKLVRDTIYINYTLNERLFKIDHAKPFTNNIFYNTGQLFLLFYFRLSVVLRPPIIY